ncbi:MAG: glycoside hydrolase family 30 protein [Planctomycetes bacterium]|nr:glycoside hydrolase family 30 protein [Planctomycetota bacterium]
MRSKLTLMGCSLYLLISTTVDFDLSENNGEFKIRIDIDLQKQFQTIGGWGANSNFPSSKSNRDAARLIKGSKDYPRESGLRDRILDAAVLDLGLNKLLLGVNRFVEPDNDNSDSDKINMSAFEFSDLDHEIEEMILPFKKRVESRGEKMIFHLTYHDYRKSTPEWLKSPAEYAELAAAVIIHLREKYGFEPEYWGTINEPGPDNNWTPESVAECTIATGRRFKKEGIKSKIAGPDICNLRRISPFLDAYEQTEAKNYLGAATYHLYGSYNNINERIKIASFASKLGIPTSMTEWMLGKKLQIAEAIYYDLTIANSSEWNEYGLCWTNEDTKRAKIGGDFFLVNDEITDFELLPNGRYLKQFFARVRPGYKRIEATSSDTKIIKSTAFLSPEGKGVLILINSSSDEQLVRISGLPDSKYQVSYTSDSAHNAKLPGVESKKRFSFKVPSKSVVTFHAADSN